MGTDKPSRRKRGAPTITDVALVAGVSPMTVSRVLKNQPRVSAETRARVMKIVEELRYSPNRSARSLAQGNPNQIGFLYANPSFAYLKNFLTGAVERARRTEHQLVIESCEPEDQESQREAVHRLANADISGAIIPPPLSENPFVLEELQRWRIRFATVAIGNTSENALTVHIDHMRAAEEITAYLISLGHRRIGFIRGHRAHRATDERERGYRKALKAAGIKATDCPVEQGEFTFDSGVVAAQRLLALDPRPTAVFASNDDMAAGVLMFAHQIGLRIPGDLSVVGFDDMEIARIVWPRLTTIRQPVAEMAVATIDLLLGDLEKRDEGQPPQSADLVFAHELVVRESSGPPPEIKSRRGAQS